MTTAQVFEESTAYALQKPLKDRAVDVAALVKQSDLDIVAITGPRRAGKSSLLMLMAQHIASKGGRCAYINAEDSRLPRETLLEETMKWFGDEGYLIIDEITSADDWSGWLARNHDMLKGRLRLMISSSRSGLVYPPKELRGRIRNVDLFPLSYSEMLDFTRIVIPKTTAGRGTAESKFYEYLRFGGFPDVCLSGNEMDKVTRLNDYFAQILAMDVAESSRQEVASVKQFGRYVLSSQYFSASRCHNFLKGIGNKIGKEKVLQMEHFSQESYLFFFVPVFGRSVMNQAQYPRKAYPVDPGFLYSVGGIEDQGRLLECAVFLELRRRATPGEEIVYWRNAAGKEVDFVLMNGAKARMAVQVSWDASAPATWHREVGSLMECIDEASCKEAMLIAMKTAGNVTDDPRIKIIDAVDWFRDIVGRASSATLPDRKMNVRPVIRRR